MNRVGIIISHGASSGGSFQWTKNILESLNSFSNNSGIKIIAFVLNENGYDKIFNNNKNIKVIRLNSVFMFMNKYIDRIVFKFPKTASIFKYISPLNIYSFFLNVELMIFPTILSATYYRKKFAFMFCDISHKYYPNFPELGGDYGIRYREAIFSNGCSNATCIIVESQELKNEVVKFYDTIESKIFVLYQTFSTSLKNSEIDEESDIILPEKYIFYPAQLWEHKNHINLFKAFKILREKDTNIYLVLTGFPKSGKDKIFDLISELDISNNICYFGYVTDSAIVKIYKNAFALVMPTYFGPTNIPTLEAFYYKCPAVISNLPGAYEQARDAVLYFDPNNPTEIAEKIFSLNNLTLRENLIYKGSIRSHELSFENYYNNRFHQILKRFLNSE
jgi:glycosyltransferase involved in cell wall biosynthesis